MFPLRKPYSTSRVTSHEEKWWMDSVFRPPSDGGLMIPPWTKNDVL